MTDRMWILFLAAAALTAGAVAQQASKEPVCIAGKVLVGDKCVPKRDSGWKAQAAKEKFPTGHAIGGVDAQKPIEPVPPGHSLGPRPHVPECKKDEILVGKKCVPIQ